MGLGFFYGNQQRWGEILQLCVANFVEGHDFIGLSVGSMFFGVEASIFFSFLVLRILAPGLAAKDLERCHWMDSTRVLGPL